MTASFIAVVLVAALMLVYWRLTLLILAAFLLALVVIGLGIVETEPATATAPTSVEAPDQIEPRQALPQDKGPPTPR